MAKDANSSDFAAISVHSERDWRLAWLGIKRQGFYLLLVAPAILLVTLLLILPLWRMFSLSFGSDESVTIDYKFETLAHYDRAITSSVYQNLFRTTFWISFLTTASCLLAGYPVAYLLANVSAKTRIVLLPLVVVPFWTSILVRTFAWRIILGRNGFINETLEWIGIIDQPFDLVFNRTGTIIGMVHILLPYMVFPIFAVMRGIPNEYMRAAENLGAGPFKAWWRIYFPLSLPGVGAGVLLVFILSIGFFVTPALLGGPGDRMISNIIELQINEVNNWEFASALAFILLGATLLLYLVYARFMSFDKLYGERR